MKLHSNRIYTPNGPKAGVLTVEGGKITAFAENTTDPEAIEYGDQRIIPGIFDTHNHGTCGYDIMNKNAPHEKQIASVKGYLKGLTSQGTVNIFPTVCDPDSIRAVAEVAKEGDQDGATILQEWSGFRGGAGERFSKCSPHRRVSRSLTHQGSLCD